MQNADGYLRNENSLREISLSRRDTQRRSNGCTPHARCKYIEYNEYSRVGAKERKTCVRRGSNGNNNSVLNPVWVIEKIKLHLCIKSNGTLGHEFWFAFTHYGCERGIHTPTPEPMLTQTNVAAHKQLFFSISSKQCMWLFPSAVAVLVSLSLKVINATNAQVHWWWWLSSIICTSKPTTTDTIVITMI